MVVTKRIVHLENAGSENSNVITGNVFDPMQFVIRDLVCFIYGKMLNKKFS